MILKELLARKEAAGKNVVVAKIMIDYIDHDDREKQGSVQLFHTCATAEEATALATKLTDSDIDNDDILYHYAHNAFNSVSSIHGSAYVDSVKIVAKEPALARKVFAFNPTDFKITS